MVRPITTTATSTFVKQSKKWKKGIAINTFSYNGWEKQIHNTATDDYDQMDPTSLFQVLTFAGN